MDRSSILRTSTKTYRARFAGPSFCFRCGECGSRKRFATFALKTIINRFYGAMRRRANPLTSTNRRLAGSKMVLLFFIHLRAAENRTPPALKKKRGAEAPREMPCLMLQQQLPQLARPYQLPLFEPTPWLGPERQAQPAFAPVSQGGAVHGASSD